MGKATNTTLSFRVSAGLKNVIGRDLISDKYIAVFELVKNSYDAGASKVRLSYRIQENGRGRLIVSDNGSGMTKEQTALILKGEEKSSNTFLRVGIKNIKEVGKQVSGDGLDKCGGPIRKHVCASRCCRTTDRHIAVVDDMADDPAVVRLRVSARHIF